MEKQQYYVTPGPTSKNLSHLRFKNFCFIKGISTSLFSPVYFTSQTKEKSVCM